MASSVSDLPYKAVDEVAESLLLSAARSMDGTKDAERERKRARRVVAKRLGIAKLGHLLTTFQILLRCEHPKRRTGE